MLPTLSEKKLLIAAIKTVAIATHSSDNLPTIWTMAIINLYELSRLDRERSNSPLGSTAETDNIQQQLQLIVRQKYLGLPVEKLLEENPLLANWIEELEQLIPGIFKPKKKLYLDLNIAARLNTDEQNFLWIEVPINLGVIKGRLKVIEWAIRQPKLSRQDCIKLWAATQYFKIEPEQLAIIICAFNLDEFTQKVTVNWSEEQHQNTQQYLVDLLNNNLTKFKESKMLFSIDDIEEVPI